MESTSERTSRAWVWAVVAALVVTGLVLWGGYSRHWSWTGINGHTATLWDWLHLLLLPLAVAVLPIWMTREARVDPLIKHAALAGGGVFAVIVLCGYLVPWAWTGFVGNSLWDWLNLVALPLAVALVPLAVEIREGWTGRHTALTLAFGAVFAVVVICGYLIPWAWTGFTGNTLWDWLHLLLLPLLIPVVVVPALVARARARMIVLAHEEDEARHAQDEARHAEDEARHAQDEARHERDEARHAQDAARAEEAIAKAERSQISGISEPVRPPGAGGPGSRPDVKDT